nr:hypothetical protein [Candidatus Njordarchaeota archaeon]
MMTSKKSKGHLQGLSRFMYGLYSRTFSKAWQSFPLEESKYIRKLHDARLVRINKGAALSLYEEAKKSKKEEKERIMVLKGYYDEQNKVIHITGTTPYEELEEECKTMGRGRFYVDGSVWWEIVIFREQNGLEEEGPIMLCHTHISDRPLREGIGTDIQVAGITKLPEMVVKATDKLDVLVYISDRKLLSQKNRIIPNELED